MKSTITKIENLLFKVGYLRIVNDYIIDYIFFVIGEILAVSENALNFALLH